MIRLEGRTALVTGASSGLGEAIARALADEGAAVIGAARRFPAGAPAAASGRVTPVRLDVTDEAAIVSLFARVDPDIVVSCAGTGVFAPFAEASLSDLREMLDVHIAGAFLCARELLRRAAARKRGGHIVNVSSIAAFRTFPASAAYSAAKEGLRGLTRVLVEEARPLDVRVTGLYPGAIDTPIWDGREGFDRAAMMRPESVAALVVEIVARPEMSVEELLVMPPKGAL